MEEITLDLLNKKLDAIMKHIGCSSLSEGEYLELPEDKKDEYDQKQVMSNSGKPAKNKEGEEE